MIIFITKQIKHNLEWSLLVLPEQLQGLYNPKTLMNCLRVCGVIAVYSVREPLTAVWSIGHYVPRKAVLE